MKFLIRLYPRAWRERYSLELEALLQDEGLTIRGVADLLMGAATLHLQNAWSQTRIAAASSGSTLRTLPAISKLAFFLALFGGTWQWVKNGNSLAGFGALTATWAVCGIKLLLGRASTSETTQARLFFSLSFFLILTASLWDLPAMVAANAKFQQLSSPTTMSLILALGLGDGVWSQVERKRQRQLFMLGCLFNSAAFAVLVMVGIMPPIPGAAATCAWLAVAAIFPLLSRAPSEAAQPST